MSFPVNTAKFSRTPENGRFSKYDWSKNTLSVLHDHFFLHDDKLSERRETVTWKFSTSLEFVSLEIFSSGLNAGLVDITEIIYFS